MAEVDGDRGATDKVKSLRLREFHYAVQSVELLLRKAGGSAHVSFSASKNARQNPRVTRLSPTCRSTARTVSARTISRAVAAASLELHVLDRGPVHGYSVTGVVGPDP